MKIFNFKRRKLFSGPHLIGTLLIIAGVFAIVSPIFLKSGSSMERVWVVGMGAITLGLLVLSSYSGVMIDIAQKRFKEYWSVAGYRFGKWIALPEISNVKVFSTTYLSSNIANGISPTLSGKVTDFKTLLYSKSSHPVLSFEYTHMDKAVKDAKLLATALDAELTLNQLD